MVSMVKQLSLVVSLGLVLAFACDSKRAEDDDDSAGEGGESTASGGEAGGVGNGGAAGRGGSGNGGSAARAGDGPGESGASSSGGSTGGDAPSGGSAGEGATGGEAGDDDGAGGSVAGNGGSVGAGAGSGGTADNGGAGGGAGASAGTGGSGTAGSGTAGSGTAGAGACGNLIDDMEAGTGYICEGNGRRGSWFSYVSTSGTFNPPGSPVPTTLLAVARGSSTRAMRAYGTNDSYAGFGCWLQETPTTYDASAYTGIRFYAMGISATLHVILQTSGTESTTYGGTCTLPTLDCAGNETTISVGQTWSLVQVPFSALTGGTVPFDKADLWSIEFHAPPGAFDFYIDDLSFY
jgi:hypothetical protein